MDKERPDRVELQAGSTSVRGRERILDCRFRLHPTNLLNRPVMTGSGEVNCRWVAIREAVHPKTGESLHPDLNHPPPLGPHWDYIDANADKWRLFPDGSAAPK